jgi:hypothetical protein
MVSVCHQIGGMVGLQGCGMMLYDLPAIRSVWFLVGLQGCGMVLYDLPAIRLVALVACKVVGDRVPLSNSLFCHF